MKRIVPYTTKSGLKIGSAYVTPVRSEMSDDALLLQRSFISTGWRRASGDNEVVCFVAAGVLLVALILCTVLGK